MSRAYSCVSGRGAQNMYWSLCIKKPPAYTRVHTLDEYGYINNSYPCNTHISTQTAAPFHDSYRLSIKSPIRFVAMVIISGWLGMGSLWCLLGNLHL